MKHAVVSNLSGTKKKLVKVKLKDNNKFVSVKHDNILFTLLATSFGHLTIINPPIYKL